MSKRADDRGEGNDGDNGGPKKNVKVERPLSEEQKLVCTFVENGEGHGMIIARAGCGKTSILIEATKRIPANAKILVLVFNRSTREDFEADLKREIGDTGIRRIDNVTVRTLNGFGFELLRTAGHYQLPVEGQASNMRLAAGVMARNGNKSAREANSLVRLAQLVQGTVVPAAGIATLTAEEMSNIVKSNGMTASEWVQQNVQELIKRRTNMITYTNQIDMSDQIWVPVKDNIPCNEEYDWVFVDECQDLNKLQIALVQKAVSPTTRVLVVGDVLQSIYKFLGSFNSVETLKQVLNPKMFGLTTCYRCPKSHIVLANAIVPDIRARLDAAEGVIHNVTEADILNAVKPGHLVMARSNPSLVKLAFELVRRNVSAKIIGENILRDDLEALLNTYAGKSNASLLAAINAEETTEKKKLVATGNDRSLTFVSEMYRCVQELAEATPGGNVDQIIANLKVIFGERESEDDTAWEEGAVLLSSVHRAKGKTRENTWVLVHSWIDTLQGNKRKKFPVDKQEELNMLYIAATRSTKTVGFVGGSFQLILDEIRSIA